MAMQMEVLKEQKRMYELVSKHPYNYMNFDL